MKDITDKEFSQIRAYIKDTIGINLGDEKKSLVTSRLRTTLQENGIDDFTEYYNYLVADKTGQAVIRFVDKITTNHTFFMREADHFDYLRDKVLPYIYEEHNRSKDLRLWCAASSSGEEPYTLQMVIQDFFKDKKETWDTQILATDISTTVLDKAVQGIYNTESVNTLPSKWCKEYFTKYDEENSIVSDKLKKQIIFRKFNLMEQKLPFKKLFHVIFCRNVMIYFDNATRDALVERFYQVTEPGGYLFIGHSESLNHNNTNFKYIMPAIYRKV